VSLIFSYLGLSAAYADLIIEPGLWYMGGALGHARYFSRYIALSIKADDIGQPLPVYQDGVFKLDGLNA